MPGSLRAGGEECGQDRHCGGQYADAQTQSQQHAVFAEDQAVQGRGPEPDRDEEAEFAAPFEDVPQHHHAEAGAAQQEAQSAEDLKGVKIGILDGVEGIQAVGRGGDLQSRILQGPRERGGDLRHVFRRGVDEEHPVAAGTGEALDKRGFVNDQAPLENRVCHRADQFDLEFPPRLVRVIQGVSHGFPQGPLNGIGVANCRDGVLGGGRSDHARIAPLRGRRGGSH